MKLIRDFPNLALIVSAFRMVANVEALSWAGLLVGMLFKYVLAGQTELGITLVAVFGAVHGGLVILYVALAGIAALRLDWPLGTAALAVVATIPPFATLAFDQWANYRGLYREHREGEAQPS
ncbi:MAG: DUF3817 domain-containing protein [Trueperaceae bacterium]